MLHFVMDVLAFSTVMPLDCTIALDLGLFVTRTGLIVIEGRGVSSVTHRSREARERSALTLDALELTGFER